MQLDKLEIEIIALARYIKENNVVNPILYNPVVDNYLAVIKEYFEGYAGFHDFYAERKGGKLTIIGYDAGAAFVPYHMPVAVINLEGPLTVNWLVP